ncbi:MAG: hypothetical protein FJ008_03660 [Chloroflexi bacterium]|nr:hypothetical protein [Chloroflexota bacterium]
MPGADISIVNSLPPNPALLTFSNSRKYAKALLEYMDEKKLTRRVGDERVAR